MKVLVIGAMGQLGSELCAAHEGTEAELHHADLDGDGTRLDIRDQAAVHELIVNQLKPDVVYNAAAAHNVPQCETEPELAFQVNALAAKNLAVACREAGSRLVHISTDYVFGHGGTRPYVETDLPAPLNVYAVTKLAGEYLIAANCPNHLIVRTAAMYGPAECRAKGGRNFVDLMLHLASTRPEVKVVTDEITTPTCAVHLAKQLILLAKKAEPGLYHATCQGACSWHEFAKEIFACSGIEINVVEAKASELQSHVERPGYSVLDNKRAREQGLDIMPDWRDALREYLDSRKPVSE